MGILRTLLLGREHGLRARLRRRLRRILGHARAPAQGARAEAVTAPAPAAPARGADGFAAVGRLSQIAPGTLREVLVGGRPVAFARIGDAVHAFEGTCPHAGGPLAEGRLVGATLTCPQHGWSFDVTTGACHVNPEDRIRILRVRVDGDVISVEA